MNLYELKPGAPKHAPKRKGRGPGSGDGKTAGRGHKGQNSRSGGGVRPGFEGGQMPLQRRIPKRGFTNIFKKNYSIVNVKDLERFDDDTVVTPALLIESGLIKSVQDGVKVLGDGELTKRLVVKAHKVSRTAESKIAARGGRIEVI